MSAEVQLPRGRYGVGISWDNLGHEVDLDLQAAIVDSNGAIIDAVYYNNLKAVRAVTHSGDETTGDTSGLDEVIWVQMTKLPPHVQMIIFVVAAFSGGSLACAANAYVHILEERKDCEISRMPLERSQHSVKPVLAFLRSPDGWGMRELRGAAVPGRHFVDILEPTLGGIIRAEIPTAPARMKVAFAMQKGSVLDLPDTSSLGCIQAGLGWDVSGSLSQDVDLDVSAVLFSGSGRLEGAVFFGNLEEFGLQHSGDNLTGEGEGDDEVVAVDLEAIPASVKQIFFVVNVYTNGVTFGQVENAYCRILDSAHSELARYVLSEGRGQRGLIISRLFRGQDDRWGFQAIGSFCNGKTWKDSVSAIEAIFHKSPRDLQHGTLDRGQTADLGRSATTSTSAAEAAAPPPKSKACALL